MEHRWREEAVIGDGIFRVCDDADQVKWAITIPSTAGPSELDIMSECQAELLETSTGWHEVFLFDRPAGGLLIDLIRVRHGLSPGECLTATSQAVRLLAGLPAPPPGMTRLVPDAFALTEAGDLVALPGIWRARADRSEDALLGDFLYTCLAGSSWFELAIPPGDLLGADDLAVKDLLIELLTDRPGSQPTTQAELHRAFLRHITTLNRNEPVAVVPAEANLDPATALTAQLRALQAPPLPPPRRRGVGMTGASASAGQQADPAGLDLSALRKKSSAGTRVSQRGLSAIAASVRRLSQGRLPKLSLGRQSKLTQDRAEKLTPRSQPRQPPRSQPKKTSRRLPQLTQRRLPQLTLRWPSRLSLRMPPRILALGLCALIVAAGVALMVLPQRTVEGQLEPTSAAENSAAPRPTTSSTTRAPVQVESPQQAFEQLSAQRVAAIAAGDSAWLAELTVPGSPAAHADATLTLQPGGPQPSLRLSELKTIEDAGDSAVISATMHSSDGTSSPSAQRITCELKKIAGVWKVYAVTSA